MTTLPLATLTPRPNTTELLPLDQYHHALVAYSGGKDSLACVLRLLELGVPKERVELWHQDVDGHGDEDAFMDWPVTRQYVQVTGEALGLPVRFQWRDGGFEREMLRNNAPTGDVYFQNGQGETVHLPTRKATPGTRMRFPQVSADLSVRWCSAYLKIDVFARALNNDPRFDGKSILVVTGERRQESVSRSCYAEFEKHRCSRSGRRVDQWRAVIDLSEEQVWQLIQKWRINVHPAYYLGWSRVSCMACIFGDRDQWASVRTLAPHTFNRISSREVQFGRTIKRGESVVKQADKGREFVSGKPERLRQLALGQTPFTLADFWVPEGQEWLKPAGAFRHGGGPTEGGKHRSLLRAGQGDCTPVAMKHYKQVNGTSYDARTPHEVIRVLEAARLNRTRLHVSLGDTETGRDWLEEFDVHGYVGRSMGPVKVPLLLANRRSHGGGALLDHCIVRIRVSAGGRVLYQHPAYHFGHLEIRPKAEPVSLPDGRVLTVDVVRDGDVHAAFEGVAQARRWVRKMGVVIPIAA